MKIPLIGATNDRFLSLSTDRLVDALLRFIMEHRFVKRENIWLWLTNCDIFYLYAIFLAIL